jgi:hypothetical protein
MVDDAPPASWRRVGFVFGFPLFARPSFAQILPTSFVSALARVRASASDDSFAIPGDAVFPSGAGLDRAAAD